MFSIKGIYSQGRIHLQEPLYYQEDCKILVTRIKAKPQAKADAEDFDLAELENLEEGQFSGQRQHQRKRAKGKISLTEHNMEYIFPLYDYSSGGLSFLSGDSFEKGRKIIAAIKDPLNPAQTLLDFHLEVMRSLAFTGGYKVGCRFAAGMDEELWHSLMD